MGKTAAIACAGALSVLLSATAPAAQSTAPVPVTVQPAVSVDVVLFSRANPGTVLTKTGADGKAMLDIGALANLGKVAVYEEKCPDRSRVLLVASDGQAPDSADCRKRRVGAFWFGRDRALNVKLSGRAGGLSPKTELIIGAAAAGAGTAVAIAASHGGGYSGGSGGGGGTGGGGTGGGVDISTRLGTFNITANKTSDTGCSFSQSFSGQVQLTGNNDGTNLTIRMIERLTRIYAGTMQSTGAFSGSGTGNLDGFQYAGTIIGTATSNSITGTETLNFTTGCPGKSVIYAFTGSK